MRIEKSKEKEEVVKENKLDAFKEDIIATVNDYQSYNLSLDEAISNTAELFKMEEKDIRTMLPESMENIDEDDDEKSLTVEKVMSKLTKEEQEFIQSRLVKEEEDEEEDDSEEDEKVEESKDGNILTIEEDWPVPGTDIVLEKGDKIRVIEAEEDDKEDKEDDEEKEE